MAAMDDLFDGINGHDVRKAHTNSRGTVMITQPTWRWPFLREPEERAEQEQPKRAGTGMIRAATALLFVLGLGLLAVSVAAQYRWVENTRHQHAASIVEALALDLGMVIFALLALGLARAGLAAKAERGLVVVCAAGSALMNLAAADAGSPRSVLAWVMPPIFLAIVVDRVVTSVRRHVLGMRDGRSPWAVAGRVTLWLLRAVLDPWPTARGVRRMVLAATPLPAPAPKAAITADVTTAEVTPETTRGASLRPGSKTAQFIDLVTERYGPLAQVPVGDVSRISAELAPEVDLNAGSARTVLRARVLAAQNNGGE
jgi:hypothetical protein